MNNVHLWRQRGAALLVSLALSGVPTLAAAANALSDASELSAMGGASIVAGSFVGLQGSAELVVESVEFVADKVRVVLKGSAKVGRTILLIPARTLGAVALASGTTVLVIAEGAGWLVTQAGRVIAYIPNAAGRGLLFSEPAS